jgi:hypothetical protein
MIFPSENQKRPMAKISLKKNTKFSKIKQIQFRARLSARPESFHPLLPNQNEGVLFFTNTPFTVNPC